MVRETVLVQVQNVWLHSEMLFKRQTTKFSWCLIIGIMSHNTFITYAVAKSIRQNIDMFIPLNSIPGRQMTSNSCTNIKRGGKCSLYPHPPNGTLGNMSFLPTHFQWQLFMLVVLATWCEHLFNLFVLCVSSLASHTLCKKGVGCETNPPNGALSYISFPS